MNDNLLPESKELAIELMMEWRAKAEAFESACERWVEAEKEWKEQLTTSQAQVAAATFALQRIRDKSRFNLPGTLADIEEIATQALSAAPKVVWSEKGTWYPGDRLCVKGLDTGLLWTSESGQAVKVFIVLDKGEGE